VSQEHLKVGTGGFNDVVNVRTTAAGTPVALTLGNGQDTVNVGNQPTVVFGSTLSGIQGELDVDGEGGSDVLNLNDQEGSPLFAPPAHNYAYDFVATRLSRSSATAITYFVESVTLNASTGDNSIRFQLPPPGKSVTINAGDGADFISQF